MDSILNSLKKQLFVVELQVAIVEGLCRGKNTKGPFTIYKKDVPIEQTDCENTLETLKLAVSGIMQKIEEEKAFSDYCIEVVKTDQEIHIVAESTSILAQACLYS